MAKIEKTSEMGLSFTQYVFIKISELVWPIAFLLLWIEIGITIYKDLVIGILIGIAALPLTILAWFAYRILTKSRDKQRRDK